MPPPEIADLWEKMRHGAFMVREQTKLKVKIRSILTYESLKPPMGYGLFTKRGVEWLEGLGLEPVDCYLRVMQVLKEEIRHLSLELRHIVADDEDVRLLMTMIGIGYFTAMLLLAEICTVDRFSSDKKFSSWMGLAPCVRQSGEKIRIGGVSGPGSRRLRWVMVQCTHTARRFDPRLRGLYERYSRRKGEKSAVVAVAHEMCRIVFFMLKRNEPYRGQNKGLTERKLKAMERQALRGLRK